MQVNKQGEARCTKIKPCPLFNILSVSLGNTSQVHNTEVKSLSKELLVHVDFNNSIIESCSPFEEVSHSKYLHSVDPVGNIDLFGNNNKNIYIFFFLTKIKFSFCHFYCHIFMSQYVVYCLIFS